MGQSVLWSSRNSKQSTHKSCVNPSNYQTIPNPRSLRSSRVMVFKNFQSVHPQILVQTVVCFSRTSKQSPQVLGQPVTMAFKKFRTILFPQFSVNPYFGFPETSNHSPTTSHRLTRGRIFRNYQTVSSTSLRSTCGMFLKYFQTILTQNVSCQTGVCFTRNSKHSSQHTSLRPTRGNGFQELRINSLTLEDLS